MAIVQDITKSILSFSSDAVVIFAVIAIFTAYGIFFGKGKILSLLLAFYPATLVLRAIPQFNNPLGSPDTYTQLGLFLIVFIVLFYIFNHFIQGQFSFSHVRKTLEASVFGLTAASLTIYFTYHVVNLQKIYNFSPSIDNLFMGNTSFWWLLAPFVIIFLFRK
jgi:hypothetical protein